MNTKGTKFLAVLAVLAMAFAAFAIVSDTDSADATSETDVAAIGTVEYDSLVDAIKAVKNGETITLQKDVAAGVGIGLFVQTDDSYKIYDNSSTAADKKDAIALKVGESFTIDLNGKTYTVADVPVGSTGTVSQAFHLEKGLTITIKNGTIESGSTFAGKMLFQTTVTSHSTM